MEVKLNAREGRVDCKRRIVESFKVEVGFVKIDFTFLG
jgi:hypothetical protein